MKSTLPLLLSVIFCLAFLQLKTRNFNANSEFKVAIRPDSVDTMNVIGTITEVEYGMCGVFCEGGMIKVKLSNKIKGYNDDYMYIITACLHPEVKINTKINVRVTKLLDSDGECYYKNFSKLNSCGENLYKLSETETAKIPSTKSDVINLGKKKRKKKHSS